VTVRFRVKVHTVLFLGRYLVDELTVAATQI